MPNILIKLNRLDWDYKSEENIWDYINRDCELDNEVMNDNAIINTVTQKTGNDKSGDVEDNDTAKVHNAAFC